MPYYYRSKFNNSYTNKPLSNNTSILGGAYKEVKTKEEIEKKKNTTIISMPKIESGDKKISSEKLRRFINFSF